MIEESSTTTTAQQQDHHRDYSLFCRTGAYLRDFDVENKPWQHELHNDDNNADTFMNFTSTGVINTGNISSRNVDSNISNRNIDSDDRIKPIVRNYRNSITSNSRRSFADNNSKVIFNEETKERFNKTREMWERTLLEMLQKKKSYESTASIDITHHSKPDMSEQELQPQQQEVPAELVENTNDKDMLNTPPVNVEYDNSNSNDSSTQSNDYDSLYSVSDNASDSVSDEGEWVDIDDVDPAMQKSGSRMSGTKGIFMSPKYVTKSKPNSGESVTEQNTITEDNTLSDSFDATSFDGSIEGNNGNNDLTSDQFTVKLLPSSHKDSANLVDNQVTEETIMDVNTKDKTEENNKTVNDNRVLLHAELKDALMQRQSDNEAEATTDEEHVMEWYTDEDLTLLRHNSVNNKSSVIESNNYSSLTSADVLEGSDGSFPHGSGGHQVNTASIRKIPKRVLERDERFLNLDELDITTHEATHTFDKDSSNEKDIPKTLERDERSLHVNEITDSASGNAFSTLGTESSSNHADSMVMLEHNEKSFDNDKTDNKLSKSALPFSDEGLSAIKVNHSMLTNDTESDTDSDSSVDGSDNFDQINTVTNQDDRVPPKTVLLPTPTREKDEITHETLDKLLDELVHRDDDIDSIFSDPFEKERSHSGVNIKNNTYSYDASCMYPIPSASASPSSSHSRRQLVDTPIQTWFGCEQLPDSFLAATAADDVAPITSKFTLYQNSRPVHIQPLLAEGGQSVGGFQVGEMFYV